MTFITEMIAVRDQAAAIAQYFGISTIQSFFVCRRAPNQVPNYLEIDPKPLIQNVSPKMVADFGQNQRIQIELDDIQVSGISHKYGRDQITGSGVFYNIGGVLTGGVLTGGYEAELVPGTNVEEKTLVWNVILRRKKRSREQ